MTYLARSQATVSGQPQTYKEHICNVVADGLNRLRDALRYAPAFSADDVTHLFFLAAEYHDLGKLDDANQAVLSGAKKSTHLPIPHADAGVAHLLTINAILPALLVYAHHKGLPDYSDIDLRGMRSERVKDFVDARLAEYLRRHASALSPKCTTNIDSPPDPPPLKTADVRVVFSCLTNADHGDAARASGEKIRPAPPPSLRPDERLKALEQYVASLPKLDENINPKEVERNTLRALFFESCRSKPENDAPLSFCDAPVGTGKTTAVMARLLGIAQRQGLRRIFVILPFTNIISQSVKTYRKALVLPGEDPTAVVAEIHHRADFQDVASRKLTALWDAPVVVTTAVAFFETLASATPSTVRRLQNLPGSAIFLDEAHAMLPAKLLPLAWIWLKRFSSAWSCHWILASGSLCHFWTMSEFDSAPPPVPNIILPAARSPLSVFEATRVNYQYKPEPLAVVDFVTWLATLDGPIIAVLNTVHTAAAAAKAALAIFGEGNVFHLSTALMPHDRDASLKAIQDRLKDSPNPHWCLIATACVEAGVDLSFKTGVRECASLLSLLQLAGRVNRNGEYSADDDDEGSQSAVWSVCLDPHDDAVVSNPAFEKSASILREYLARNAVISPGLCTEAFRREIRESAVFSSELQNKEKNYAFSFVESKFNVIDDQSEIAVVDPVLIDKIRRFKDVSWHDIQMGSVRVRRKILEKMAIQESTRYPGVYLWTAEYSPFLGYMEGVLKLEAMNSAGFAMV